MRRATERRTSSRIGRHNFTLSGILSSRTMQKNPPQQPSLSHSGRRSSMVRYEAPYLPHIQHLLTLFLDGLFSKKATDGQKFKGFAVFQKVLGSLITQRSKLACIFSKNFLGCLINQTAKEDRFLNRAAEKSQCSRKRRRCPARLPAFRVG